MAWKKPGSYSLLDPDFGDPERARYLRRAANRLGKLGALSAALLGILTIVLVAVMIKVA
jgi:hypothetical protein